MRTHHRHRGSRKEGPASTVKKPGARIRRQRAVTPDEGSGEAFHEQGEEGDWEVKPKLWHNWELGGGEKKKAFLRRTCLRGCLGEGTE